MACYNCNYQHGNFNCHVCRGQTPNPMAGVAGSSAAGEQLGEGLVTLVFAILTNRFLSFPSFYFAAQGLLALVLSALGLLKPDETGAMPTWIVLLAVLLPAALMVVYRKKMPLLAVEAVRWILILLLLKLFWWVITSETG